jgi:hypothetical protein
LQYFISITVEQWDIDPKWINMLQRKVVPLSH